MIGKTSSGYNDNGEEAMPGGKIYIGEVFSALAKAAQRRTDRVRQPPNTLTYLHALEDDKDTDEA